MEEYVPAEVNQDYVPTSMKLLQIVNRENIPPNLNSNNHQQQLGPEIDINNDVS